MPEGSRPKRILSRKRLQLSWQDSRDAGSNPAIAGLDGQRVSSFVQDLDGNISRLHCDIISGRFHFSKLKAAIIPKQCGKLRVIAIPTVKDRLVQRTIGSWLIENRIFVHQDFVYGLKGDGVRQATGQALKLRRVREWCVKTDIHAFFDNIDREKLKARIAQRLRSSSILPFLFDVIDSEIKPRSGHQQKQIEAAGIRTGFGIRQGMPLSPLLANISLSRFDVACKKHAIQILRYADDIIAFFSSENAARAGLKMIEDALSELELQIPQLGSAKTELVAPGQPVTFLGREIVYLKRAGDYVSKVGDKKLFAIKSKLEKDHSLSTVIADGSTMSDAVKSLTSTVSSYLGAYRDAYNFNHFDSELRHSFKQIMAGWFVELFGADAMAKISSKHRLFLGLRPTEELAPTADVEIAY